MLALGHLKLGALEPAVGGLDPAFAARNELLEETRKRRPIMPLRPEAVPSSGHRWKVTVAKTKETGIWRVNVGSGSVNNEPAAITYRREDDPRGWIMPEDYPPFRPLARVYGPDFPFVDRPLFERTAPPHLRLTAPDAGEQDLGGFVRVTDGLRPPYFRTARMWERNLYRAHIILSGTPYKADRQDVLIATRGPTLKRWRVFAGIAPPRSMNIALGAAKELARLFLVRQPGHPEADTIHVRQKTWWSLQTKPSIGRTLPLIPLDDHTTFGGLGFGVLDEIANAYVDVNILLADLIVNGFNSIVFDAATQEFWSV